MASFGFLICLGDMTLACNYTKCDYCKSGRSGIWAIRLDLTPPQQVQPPSK